MKLPKVLIGDDHSVTRAGLRSVLADFCEVIEEARDGRALVDAALSLRPDLIILPVSMSLLNGIDAARQIRARWPTAKLLFFSMHSGTSTLREALEVGGAGYLVKSSPIDEIRTAIAMVLRGDTYVSSSFSQDVVEDLRIHKNQPGRSARQLTMRQREILQLIAEGRTNKEIAQIMRVSVKTVEFHRARIMAKFGVHTVAEMAVAAVRIGLIREPNPPSASGENESA